MSRVRPKHGNLAERHLRPAHVPEGSVVTVFRVPPEQAGQRLDVFLQGELRRTSRSRAQHIIRASAHDAAGKRMRPGQRLLAEQRVLLWREPWDETPVPQELPILYEDEHLLAIDKPAGLPVHPTARYHKNTLINMLKAQRPDEFLSLGHRLDRETSGVLLVSKTPECDRTLKSAFEAREGIEKQYIALTWGMPNMPAPTDTAGVASLPARTRVRFRYERSVELDPDSSLGVKMCLGKTPDALHAATWFEVLGVRQGLRPTLNGDEPTSYTKIACDLETGRQHQIRIHLWALGAPIVGDKLYGPDERLFARCADGELTEDDEEILEIPRHALHAARLSLTHPMTGAPLEIQAPFPADLESFWQTLTP